MEGVKVSLAAARRARGAFVASEQGQSLIEVVIAIGIFAITSAALISLLTSSLNTTNFSRQKTLAQQAAAKQIEYIRTLQYSQVGTNPGNPVGIVAPTQTISIGGPSATTEATMKTKIVYVNDPTPLSYQSNANYKQVTITINRASDGRQLASQTTNIAPPVKASQSQGAIVVTVIDSGNNQVVPNATVNINNGPSGSETDTSDASGKVTFAGLTPTNGSYPNYDVTVTPPAGYVALKDTQPPALVAHFGLAPGQTQPSAIQIYQPVTIYVQLFKSDGVTPFTGSASVAISSSRGSVTTPYTSPQIAVTQLSNGEKLVPGLNYTITVTGTGFSGATATTTATVPANSYPTNLSSTFAFTAAAAPTNTVLPAITGTTSTGQTLTASTGSWTGVAPITYAYQWQRCSPACSNVGSNSATYDLTGADAGATMHVIVSATNIGGTTNATSNPTAAVAMVYGTLNVTVTNNSGTKCTGGTVKVSGGGLPGATQLSSPIGPSPTGVATFTNNVPTNPASGPQYTVTATTSPGNKTGSANITTIITGANATTVKVGSSC
jgi:hypothetical protein